MTFEARISETTDPEDVSPSKPFDRLGKRAAARAAWPHTSEFRLPDSPIEQPDDHQKDTLKTQGEEAKIEAGIGMLVTVWLEGINVEQKVYIAEEANDIKKLPPEVQAKLSTEEKLMVRPLYGNPTHKEKTLAQLLEGKEVGSEIPLPNGKKAKITNITNLEDIDSI